MTKLDDEYAGLLSAGDDPAFTTLVAELDTLGEGSPSSRGDMMVRHALAVHAQELAEQGPSRPRMLPRRGRWADHLRPRVSVAVAASVIALLGAGTYLHGQGATPVSAQTVLHRAAAAGPGANQATHATYHVSASDGTSGTADVWIGYDGSGTATQLAQTLSMAQNGQSAGQGSAGLVVVGPGLAHLYDPSQRQVPAQPPPGAQLTSPPSARFDALARTMRGIVVGTLLAQKLSAQPDAYTLKQETLDGVSVYAFQPADAGGATYYYNAQTYALQGADWTQNGVSWQVRLTGISTVPISAVPPNTFGSKGPISLHPGLKPGPGDGHGTSVRQGVVTTTQRG